MNNKRDNLLTPILIVLGFGFGALSKAGDVSGHGELMRNILNAFGSVSTGFFIWVVICTAIALLSKKKIWASINIFFFLVSMLSAYYLYSYFIVNYLYWGVVKFWLAMIIPAMILGFIVWHIKTNRILKYIVIVIGTVIMLVDMYMNCLYSLIAAIMMIILYVVFLALILSKRFDKT